MEDLSQFAPPDVPLRLTADGPGSRSQIVAYIQSVIGQRTTPNDDTSAERLARAITTSVLHRLGAGYSIASGAATVALVPAWHPDTESDERSSGETASTP